jgi:hypothetical protein
MQTVKELCNKLHEKNTSSDSNSNSTSRKLSFIENKDVLKLSIKYP